VDHCKKVFCELFVAPTLDLIEKDESGACSGDDPLNQFDSKAGESVAVGHHNFVDQSFLDVFQKPREAFPFVVEARGDVFVDFVVWELGLYRFDLSLEVVFLLSGRDPAVDGALARFLLADGGACLSGEV
jgi:hypothetical protein